MNITFIFCELSHKTPFHTLRQYFSKTRLPQLVYLSNMSHVDACHVVVTMHLYKHWPLVRAPPSVSKCARSDDQCRQNEYSKRSGVWLR